jgi:FKBP-type peptidyl-prolyl cis-trans isomerase FklB
MKNCLLLLCFSLFCFQLRAQTKKKPPVSSTTQSTPVSLKDQTDSLSYSVGVMIANFYKQQGITKINNALVQKGMLEEMNGDKTVLSIQQCNQVLMGYIEKVKADKAMASKQQAIAFLSENKNKPGVITTASGLQYMVLKEGTGPKPLATDKVKCDYEGKLIDGTVFDSSVKQGKPIEFQVNGVIRGWTEALQLMNTGSKYRLFIPPDLGYGDQQMGPDIKPGSLLIFDVDLIEIVK